jgi:hypothetical protein
MIQGTNEDLGKNKMNIIKSQQAWWPTSANKREQDEGGGGGGGGDTVIQFITIVIKNTAVKTCNYICSP